MKRIIAFAVAVLLFVFPVFAAENEGKVSLKNTEGLTLCTKDNVPSKDGKIFDISEDEFKKYLAENNVLLYGADNGNAFVFELTGDKTEFTQNIKDFANISKDDIKDFADKTLSSEYSLINMAGNDYIVTDLSDQEKNYTTRQYVTVKHSTLYVVTFTVPGASVKTKTDARIKNIVVGLDFGETDKPEEVSLFAVIGIALAILVIVALAVYVIITFVKDFKNKKDQPENV